MSQAIIDVLYGENHLSAIPTHRVYSVVQNFHSNILKGSGVHMCTSLCSHCTSALLLWTQFYIGDVNLEIGTQNAAIDIVITNVACMRSVLLLWDTAFKVQESLCLCSFTHLTGKGGLALHYELFKW